MSRANWGCGGMDRDRLCWSRELRAWTLDQGAHCRWRSAVAEGGRFAAAAGDAREKQATSAAS